MDKITIYLREPNRHFNVAYSEEAWAVVRTAMSELCDVETTEDELIMLIDEDTDQEYFFWASNILLAYTR